MSTQRVFSTSGANGIAIEVDAPHPNSTAILATSGNPASGGNPGEPGGCIHAISDSLPAIRAENTHGNAIVVTGTILAQGTPAIDANDNSPNELDIPPGSTGTPANGTLTVDPLVEGSVAIIQARATADKVAGIKATSGGG